MTRTATQFGTLTNYRTGEAIRPATADEREESIAAAQHDGGAGVIEVEIEIDGLLHLVPCFVA